MSGLTSADVGRAMRRHRALHARPRWKSHTPGWVLVGASLTAVLCFALALALATAGAAEHDPDDWCTVTVEPGDSLSGIMADLGFTGPDAWRVLWARNPQVVDPDLIRVGDRLDVCYGTHRAAPTAPPPVAVDVSAEVLSRSDVAALVADAGFADVGLWTAIAMGESSGRVCAAGDLDKLGQPTADGRTWGPSLGLFQIRSIDEAAGTGDWRDPERLCDPLFNLEAALAISSGGTDASPWGAYTSGAYARHLHEDRP